MSEGAVTEMEVDATVPSAALIGSDSSTETGSTNRGPEQASISSPKTDDVIEIIDVSPSADEEQAQQQRSKNKRKSPNPTDEVVILDDEDKVDADGNRTSKQKRTDGTVPEVKECDIIDLVEKKKKSANTRCINYECNSGLELTEAPVFCLTFYRVKNSGSGKREVCKQCFDLALNHYELLAASLMKDELLMDLDIPIRNDVVEIDDSDSDENVDKEISECFDAASINVLRENFDKVLNEVVTKYKLEEQAEKSMAYLMEKGKTIKANCQEVDTMLHNVRKQLDTIHHDLYAEFKVHYEFLPPIDITDVYYPNARSVVRTPTLTGGKLKNAPTETEKRNLRKTKQISYVELEDPGSSSSNSPIVLDSLGRGKDSSKDIIEAVELPPVPKDLPPRGALQKPSLKCGETYYAVRFTTMSSWVRVKLTNVIKPGALVNGQAVLTSMYCVMMENKPQTNRLVTGKEIAYAHPSSVSLDVGTRVIAVFREAPSTGEMKKIKKEAFYPGIVAEPLSFLNRYRYLIFFDDGYAQYVDHKMVYLIYESSKDVWDDMHVDSRIFIKKYLESYPERPMVKLRKDQTVRTEYNGKWWLATVMNIDCSLVQMFFEVSNRIEWIYRGSTRLNPMFKEEQAATNRLQNKPRTPRKFNESGPYVQYTRNEPDNSRENVVEPIRAVARKSTTTTAAAATVKSTRSNLLASSFKAVPTTVPFLPIADDDDRNDNSSNNNGLGSKHQTPPASKVVYFTPRAQTNTKTLFKEHRCSALCKNHVTYDVNKLKGYNPLSKPLLCGWNRVTYKNRSNRVINYKAPCGRFIRTREELHKYLRDTRSEMTVDLFDFDFWVHCLAEFVLERNSTIKKDMSGGLENVAIPVVNYVDNDMNSFYNYSIKREPMEGVSLNLDPEFLCGCDCEDDCQDKTKCTCWQLTLQGLPYLAKSADNVGYQFRRLPEAVPTGIYECNSRCKCAKTCLNRVVQNPLQLKLQVFKTHNRGWGIRCLNDIPQGAFICIYAGSILTEQMANEGGKNYGDEYLAELDYIEVVEKMKEDYEDDVSDDVDDNKKRSNKKGDESGDDEEKIEPPPSRGSRKRGNTEDDTDFVPGFYQRDRTGENSSYKARLRRRPEEDDDTKSEEQTAVNKTETKDEDNNKTKNNDDDTVTISDDEEVVREPSSFNPRNESDLDDSKPRLYKSVRDMYAVNECVYVMDAKVTGNIGRFLNHSCSPNVFVQNVFVDTHDLRFPWVAFFAITYIRAGTELTWNYNYDVGSVPGKVLYCHCASPDCRGRLL